MAEMERKKESKQKEVPKISDEEKRKKLQKLLELKAKLEELEKTDTDEKPIQIQPPSPEIEKIKPIAPIENIQNVNPTADDEDEHFDQMDKELSALEDSISKDLSDIELAKIEETDKVIEKISSKLGASTTQIKSKTSTQEDDELERELEKLQLEINKEVDKNAAVTSIFDKLCQDHSWLKEPQYGFMYSMPDKKKNKKDFDSWLDDWNKVLFDYARIASEHIIYSKLILSEKPWSDLKNRVDSISEIADSMVKNKVAEWLDKKKEKLRVYWKSLEDWADVIVKWAKKMAMTEPILIQDLQEAEQPFSNLPEEDFEKIFNIINKNGQGIKHKLPNGQSAIVIKF
jgi:hypothetical protein